MTLQSLVFPEDAGVAAAPGRSPAGHAASALRTLLYPELGEVRGARRRAAAVKRALDVVASAALLLALAPLGLLIAGLVRVTSPGPVLFRQVRVGYEAGPSRC